MAIRGIEEIADLVESRLCPELGLRLAIPLDGKGWPHHQNGIWLTTMCAAPRTDIACQVPLSVATPFGGDRRHVSFLEYMHDNQMSPLFLTILGCLRAPHMAAMTSTIPLPMWKGLETGTRTPCTLMICRIQGDCRDG